MRPQLTILKATIQELQTCSSLNPSKKIAVAEKAVTQAVGLVNRLINNYETMSSQLDELQREFDALKAAK